MNQAWRARGTDERNVTERVDRLGALTLPLLRARTIRDIASVATSFAISDLHCRAATLVWSAGTVADGRLARRTEPERLLSSSENLLVSQALASSTPLEVPTEDGSAVRVALPLGGPTATARAVLLVECSAETRESVEVRSQWDSFVEMVSARSQSALETERLSLTVERLEAAERLQRALYAIADLASSDLDMPDMLRGVHEIVGRLMYAENFYIVLRDRQQDALRFVYFVDIVDTARPDPDQLIPYDELESSLTLAMVRSGKALMGPSRLLRDALGIGDDTVDRFGPAAADWLGVPMLAGGIVHGGVVVQSYDPSTRFTDQDQALLSYVAQHILTALQRKQAQEELEARVILRTAELADVNRALEAQVAETQRSERLQAALFRIAEVANNADTIEQFYAAVHGIVGDLIYAKNFFIALVSDDGREVYYPYASDERDPQGMFAPRRIGRGLTDYVLRTGKALLAKRAEIDHLNSVGEVVSIGSKSVCWLGVPLVLDDRVVGVLAAQSYTPEVMYSERDQDLLTFVSYHIATALQRKRTQDSLRAAYADLEDRVAARTHELAQANRDLLDQIGERERVEERLKYQALHDSLTGLPNRVRLLDRLGHALSRYRRDPEQQFAVLFLDLDRFKVVNDSVGHLFGDLMLKEASRRIAACLRAQDTVARLGGDEFALLLEDIHEPNDACQVAERVIASLTEPMRIEGKELFSSASIGIALSAPRYERAEELLRDADVAMYRAKARGRQRYEMFDETLHREALKLLDMEGDLRRAIVRNEFEPHFQSIVRLRDARVTGYEALLRWRHPERGLLLPGDFLAVAEDSGSIEPIDWQMFEATCKRMGPLVESGAYVCINVSARHFRLETFPEQILGMVERCGIDSRFLRLEVTEGTLLENPEQIRRTLEKLRFDGVVAQVDDFGTGYSSLSYLHRFPLSALKIDRSFVADLRPGESGGSAAVVRAIRALAASLGMEVIAEGIETTEQRDALLELGCEMGQGFLFSHPQPLDEVLHAIRAESAARNP